MYSLSRRLFAPALAALLVLVLTTGIAGADDPWTTVSDDFESPLFGLAPAPGGGLVVADGAGPVELRNGQAKLINDLPGLSDVAPIGRGEMLALAGTEEGASLYKVSNGRVKEIANISQFEAENDPAGDGVESNPFDLARLNGHRTIVADAAGNSILTVDNKGNVDWVATLPQHDVETQWLKDIVGCPSGDPEVAFICELPPVFPADPVPTTVAIGPDGAIYTGELTGFPATPGTSRVWRIEPGALHVRCGIDPGCTLVDTGPFTSIIDMNFGPDGTAYVLEMDEASWLAAEEDMGVGGTVNACTGNGAAWTCTEVATGLPLPTAVAIDGGDVYVTLFALIPGMAQVAMLP
jgi:hypothetical protein